MIGYLVDQDGFREYTLSKSFQERRIAKMALPFFIRIKIEAALILARAF